MTNRERILNNTQKILENNENLVNIITKIEKIPTPPKGTIDITENGLVDVTNYAEANVNVSGGGDLNEYFIMNPTGAITFRNCIKTIPADLDTSNVTSFSSCFQEFQALEELPILNTEKSGSFANMFNYCTKLKKIKIVHRANKITSINNMFANCSALTDIDMSECYSTKAANFANMFNNCNSLINLDISNLRDNTASTMTSMFNGCRAIKKIDLKHFTAEKLTAMGQMFQNCYAVEEIDISGLNTKLVTAVQQMFYNCYALQKINMKNFNPVRISSYSSMFDNVPTTCEIITNQTMANWISSKFPTMTNITIVKADWE